MNNDEPIYELSANWEWAHEAFFKQHFVGKRLSREPYAKGHHVTFTDGTAVAVTDGERNKVYHVDRDSYTGAGVIERALGDPHDHPVGARRAQPATRKDRRNQRRIRGTLGPAPHPPPRKQRRHHHQRSRRSPQPPMVNTRREQQQANQR